MSTLVRFYYPICLALFTLGQVPGCVNSADPTEPGEEMRPGDNCLRCHNERGQAKRIPWTAGGTVFPTATAKSTDGVPGAEIVFMDSSKTELFRVETNAVGNFYTNQPLPEGFLVAIEYQGRRAEMPKPPPAGSCNACHSLDPVGDALGRIRLP